jgi:hypothetical protein
VDFLPHQPEVVQLEAFTAEKRRGILACEMFTRGLHLRALRERHGRQVMTQRELARIAKVGVGTVQRAEADADSVTYETWDKLFSVFGAELVTVDDAIRTANTATEAATRKPGSTAERGGGDTPTTTEASDYLAAMQMWWHELEAEDRERTHDFARDLRDARREQRKQKAG